MDPAMIREMLAADRAATIGRLRAMTDEFAGIMATSAGANIDDEHDPEGSTTGFERARVTALATQARRHLDDLDRGLARLSSGTYEVCEDCHGPIAPERLAARPTARTCIGCARTRR
jgi:DnaK suppressor protein